MTQAHRWSRIGLAAGSVALAAQLFHPMVASAQWSATGSGPAGGAATTMPSGSTPVASARSDAVLVSWTAATMGNGAAVGGYVIHRYNAINGSPATVGAGCAGVITGSSCTEDAVPSGAWVYTDTPVQGGWTGAESPNSPVVAIP